MDETSGSFWLSAGKLSVDLVPAMGGSLAALRHGDTDLMRPLSAKDRDCGNAAGAAMFPMIPYANRIAGNRYDFAGKSYHFSANNPPDVVNVHGTGWRSPWTMDWQTESRAQLSLAIRAPQTPYLYHATQLFHLDRTGLSVTLSVTNDAAEPMPFGFGLHPWFFRDPDVTLQFGAQRFYLEEPGHIAGDPVSLMPELDFATPRSLPDRWRNNDYGGWDGVATLRFPSRNLGLRIVADAVFGHLMVYADPESPYFCVEPQTHAAGAFNRRRGFEAPEEGVLILRPGQTAGGSVRFEVFAIDQV